MLVYGILFTATVSGGMDSDMFTAIRDRSVERVRQSIASGTNVNASVGQGIYSDLTMLIQAVHYAGPSKSDDSDLQIIRELLRAGADPMGATRDGLTPIMFATRMNNSRIVSLLRKSGAKLPDESIDATRALYTKVDAYLILSVVDQYAVETGGGEAERVPFAKLERYSVGYNWEIIRRSGIDPFGNPLVFCPRSDFLVGISISSASHKPESATSDFWRPFPVL